MRAFAISLLLVAAPALADPVARNGDDSVRLTMDECPQAVQAKLDEPKKEFYRLAKVEYQGAKHDACWAMSTRGTIHLIYEDGDQGEISRVAFREEIGI